MVAPPTITQVSLYPGRVPFKIFRMRLGDDNIPKIGCARKSFDSPLELWNASQGIDLIMKTDGLEALVRLGALSSKIAHRASIW